MAKENLVSEVLELLEDQGLQPWVARTKRHAVVKWKVGDRVHSMPVAGTPSDPRSRMNTLKQVQRMVRRGYALVSEGLHAPS